jgi:hypothetical protein
MRRDAPEHLPIVVRRIDGGPSVVVEDASLLAHAFFTSDPSSVGPKAYDQHAGRGDLNRITTDDVRTINQTMRARSRHTAWETLTSAGPLPWLAVLDPSWDLIELPDREWEQLGCTELLEAVFAAALGPYRNHAVASKVLHLKRPLLIPILDSLVVEQIGGGERTPAIDLVLHVRAEGQRNRFALRQVQASLEESRIARPLVRILDVLLWSGHPAAGLKALTGWERVIRPASGTTPATDVDLLGSDA